MELLTHLSLFSGIGGIDLAAKWAGFRTVGQVEIDPYCQKVLTKHWPNVPKWSDIRRVTGEDVRKKTKIETITLITGGYPCQGESTAGQRKGKADDRWLWPEMARLIQEIRPSWVVGENVAGHITLGLPSVLSDLEAQGFGAQVFVIPACAVGAWHRRNRVWIVAHLDECGCELRRYKREGIQREDQTRHETDSSFETLANIDQERCQERWRPQPINQRPGWPELKCGDWWSAEPRVVRVVYGVSEGMDRRRVATLGEAVVPQQVYPILKAIADIEKAKWIELARKSEAR